MLYRKVAFKMSNVVAVVVRCVVVVVAAAVVVVNVVVDDVVVGVTSETDVNIEPKTIELISVSFASAAGCDELVVKLTPRVEAGKGNPPTGSISLLSDTAQMTIRPSRYWCNVLLSSPVIVQLHQKKLLQTLENRNRYYFGHTNVDSNSIASDALK
jgi:hypothetical protein